MTFIGLGVFAFLATTGISYAAPWYFMAPLGISGVMLIWNYGEVR